jgi:TonB family protein
VDGTSIEVDEIVPKHIETLDDPVEHLPEVAHASPMRGAPSHVNIVAVAASVATSTDVVPDPPPVDVPTPPRFKLGGGEGGGNAKAAPAAHADRTFSESEVTDRATLLSGPKPVYPATALADGIELDAPLAFEIVVDTNGAVISTRPLGVAGHGFDEAALSAVRAFRFTPAKRDGDLVRVRMRWTVEFHLKG